MDANSARPNQPQDSIPTELFRAQATSVLVAITSASVATGAREHGPLCFCVDCLGAKPKK